MWGSEIIGGISSEGACNEKVDAIDGGVRTVGGWCTDGVEPAPNLFEAIQEQLGLRLRAQKIQVDVLAVDHVEKPSAN
jgi:hypothetical protein